MHPLAPHLLRGRGLQATFWEGAESGEGAIKPLPQKFPHIWWASRVLP